MNKKSTIWLIAIFCLFAFQTFAQKAVLISGIVRFGKGNETLPGVGIKLKGTNTVAVTNKDGKFSISVPNGQGTLTFTYIGTKTKEVVISGQASLDVILEDDVSALNEVVVIGYGQQSRATLATSISKVDASEFQNAASANPLAALQGKVAGLSLQISSGQPGESPQIFLRGGSSTSPQADPPLFIVDGIVGRINNIADLNPDDIEFMQVLKDAASTAIYGARAANGVIIVKTKSGKLNTKPSINFKYTYGLDRQVKEYDYANASDYIYISRLNTQKFNTTNPAQYLTSGAYGMSTGNARNTRNTLEFLDTYITNYGKDYVSGLIDNEGWQTMTDPVTGKKLIFKETNFQDVTFQDASRKEYDFNISGGTDKSTYYIGMGHMNQSGLLLGTFYKNYNFLLNGTYKLSEKWELNTNVSYVMRKENHVGNVANVLARAISLPSTYRLNYEDGLPAPGEGVNSVRNRNHEVYYRDQYNDYNTFKTNLNIGATWKIIPGLTFKPAAYWNTTQGLGNAFEAYNELVKTRPASSQSSLRRQGQLDGVFNYDKTIAEKHNISAVLGSSYINEYRYVMDGSGYGAPTDNIHTLNATSVLTQRTSTRIVEKATMSFFGRAAYDYDRKYFMSASLRNDGSSFFSEEYKYGLFAGLSAGWNVHREKFWEPVKKYVSSLKLRSSWGQAGNDGGTQEDGGDYTDSQGLYAVGNTYMGENGILNTVLANRFLKWETTTTFDAGADIGFLNDRFSLLVDYYSKVTSDRLFDKPLDATSGFGTIKSNLGSIRTRGLEFELSAKALQSRDFSWNVNLNFAYNRSIAVKLPPNDQIKNRIGGAIVWNKELNDYERVGGTAEGERYAGRWAYHMIGVYATDEEAASAPRDPEAGNRVKKGGDAIWEDLDNNGIIDNRDMIFMGYIRPDKQGGMVNTFKYKNLSMRVAMDFAVGHVIDNAYRARANGNVRNNGMVLNEVLGPNIWNNQGDQATIPRYTVQSDADYLFKNHLRNSTALNPTGTNGAASSSSLYYSKGDFLAFREVSFTYTLKADFLKKAHINAVNLYAGVFNLGYLTKYDGLMPEIFTGNDPGSYPRPRQINFGATLNF